MPENDLPRTWRLSWAGLCLLAVVAAAISCGGEAPAPAAQQVTTIYIVRHAEKATSGGDPPLTTAGHVRAKELAHVLQDAGIDAIFASHARRTKETAAPTAAATGKTVTSGDAASVVKSILAQHAGEQVLVVGHSNTVDDIAAGLGAKGVPSLNLDQYDRLFVVHRCGKVVHLERLRYGVQTP